MLLKRRTRYADGSLYGLSYRCPGCEGFHERMVGFHTLPIEANPEGRDHWNFNGVYERPTFSPSVKRSQEFWAHGNDAPAIDYVCHHYVTDGEIQYLDDCTHQLAGQTVPMVPWE